MGDMPGLFPQHPPYYLCTSNVTLSLILRPVEGFKTNAAMMDCHAPPFSRCCGCPTPLHCSFDSTSALHNRWGWLSRPPSAVAPRGSWPWEPPPWTRPREDRRAAAADEATGGPQGRRRRQGRGRTARPPPQTRPRENRKAAADAAAGAPPWTSLRQDRTRPRGCRRGRSRGRTVWPLPWTRRRKLCGGAGVITARPRGGGGAGRRSRVGGSEVVEPGRQSSRSGPAEVRQRIRGHEGGAAKAGPQTRGGGGRTAELRRRSQDCGARAAEPGQLSDGGGVAEAVR